MFNDPGLLYCPALRLKKGELTGIGQLAPDVADRVLPRLIIMPKDERDKNQQLLFDLKKAPDYSLALASSWRRRPLLLDATYILDECGCNEAEDWLPQIFQRAKSRDVWAIPTFLLNDLRRIDRGALLAALSLNTQVKLGVGVSFDALEEADFQPQLLGFIKKIGLVPSDCALYVDFFGTDFSNPDLVSPVIVDVFERIRDNGDWAKLIFQGTHYPEVNPAKVPGQLITWPRNEWIAWKQAFNMNSTEFSSVIFGDYAADSAKMSFDGGGRPIEHLRYATPQTWLIQRAVEGRTRPFRMNSVYNSIASNREFQGKEFSEADLFIVNAAISSNEPQGDPTTWRQLNTTHHVTQVVSDLTKILGKPISTLKASRADHQFSLLD